MIDAYKASYGVEDPEFAITQLAQTTMRSELGKISLDSVFKERESLNTGIVEAINKASSDWGISCLRYEIRDIKLPDRVQEAMQMQVEAERKKRATVLESEGTREAEINVAEGQKRSRVLASEALKFELTNRAHGECRRRGVALTLLHRRGRGCDRDRDSQGRSLAQGGTKSQVEWRRSGCSICGGTVRQGVQRTCEDQQHPHPLCRCCQCLLNRRPGLSNLPV